MCHMTLPRRFSKYPGIFKKQHSSIIFVAPSSILFASTEVCKSGPENQSKPNGDSRSRRRRGILECCGARRASDQELQTISTHTRLEALHSITASAMPVLKPNLLASWCARSTMAVVKPRATAAAATWAEPPYSDRKRFTSEPALEAAGSRHCGNS